MGRRPARASPPAPGAPRAPAPRAEPRPWTRGELGLLAALALLALALRVAFVLASRASPFFDAPQMDALYHLEWARAVAAGEAFQDPPFFRAPLYPWLLGLLLRLCGDGLLAPRLAQSLLGTATVVLVYLVGRRAFDRRVAALAGLFAATWWVPIFFDGELLLEVLATPLYALGIWLSLGLGRAPRPGLALGAGLAWGLSAITRPNVLLFLPLLLAWLAVRAWRATPRAPRPWLAPALLALGIAAPIAPIAAYNAVAGGDAVLIASQGGVNLWIGNNPQSDGSTALVPGTREDWWGGYRDAIALAERAEGRALRPSEVSRHYTRRALAWIAEEPLAWLRLTGWKLRLFLMDWELGNNEEPRFLARHVAPWTAWLPWSFGLLAPLALVGIAVTRAGGWRCFPLWGFLAVYSASVVLFFVNARFRLPLLPAVEVYAAAALVWGWEAARARRWAALGIAAPALAALVALSKLAVPAQAPARSQSNGLLMLAQAEARAGDLGAAIPLFEGALRAAPGNSIAWRGLAFARRAAGDPAGAEQAFREALRLRADDVDALSGYADLLLAAGRAGEALELAQRAVAAAPHAAGAHYDLGRALLARGAPEPAAEAFRAALERDPRHFGAAYALARAEDELGRADRALAALLQAVGAREPDEPRFLLDAQLRAAERLARAGRRAEALAVVRAASARFPADPRPQQLLRELERDP